MNRQNLLIVDDEEGVLRTLEEVLAQPEVSVLSTTSSAEALHLMREKGPAVVVTDLRMPGLDGLGLLKKIREFRPETPVIVITGHGSVDDAVAAMKAGAYDFISKPLSVLELQTTVKRALEKASLQQENLQLRESLRKSRTRSFEEGNSPLFRELLDAARLAANSEATILILGESGTGKEILASYIAGHSPRAEGPFVAVNCAAIPENLIEAELFGHKRGAFTGAHQDRKGRFQEADKGTIFLDEIGELPLAAQSKLLRVLQEGEATPVGGSAQKVNVRVIAATNKPLREMAAAGTFREDLFYRLNVVDLHIPPLRQRMEDLPSYIAFFIHKFCRKNHRDPVSIAPEALRFLETYSWPGNLRELENVLERAIILTPGNQVTEKVLPPELREPGDRSGGQVSFPRGMKMEEIELQVIREALSRNHGDRAKSAEELGISVRTVYRRLNEMQAHATGPESGA
jgi:two-component system response regulator HydG